MTEQEKEDQEQIEYLRQWKGKREKKRENRRKVKLYDRLFAGCKRRDGSTLHLVHRVPKS